MKLLHRRETLALKPPTAPAILILLIKSPLRSIPHGIPVKAREPGSKEPTPATSPGSPSHYPACASKIPLPAPVQGRGQRPPHPAKDPCPCWQGSGRPLPRWGEAVFCGGERRGQPLARRERSYVHLAKTVPNTVTLPGAGVRNGVPRQAVRSQSCALHRPLSPVLRICPGSRGRLPFRFDPRRH